MALRVPTVTGPGVAEQGLPGARQSSVASPDLLGATGRQMQQFGAAAENTGAQFNAQLNAQRKQLYDQANAARVDDALNSATELANRLQHDKTEGYTAQTGYDALNRSSGMPLADEYTGKLREQVDKIAGGLGNEDQRRMFSMRANNLVTGFHGGAMAYEAKEQHGYVLSVKDAAAASARNSIALNPEPENIAQQSTRIRASIEGGQDENGNFIPGSAQMQGKSAAWAKERADEVISDALGNAIKGLMEGGSINMAMAYFKRYGGQMTAKDTLEVQGKLQHEYDTHLGAAVGNRVFDGAAPAIAPSGYTRLTSLVMGAESGGRRYGADGALLASPKGAKGEMQVVDSTNRDPGFGVRPAADDSPDERARVGRDYLGAMVKEYRGDIRKALAAYNAGPGAVNEAVKAAGQGLRTGSDFLAFMPKETRDYVVGITAKYAGGEGAPQKPTLAELHDQVRATLGPNASSIAVKTATEQVTQRFTDAEKAVKQRGEEVVATAMQALTRNGGRYSELPAGVRADLAQHAPDKVDSVLNFGARVAKGDDSTNPALYLRLSDPNTLRGMSEAQLYGLRGQLSTTDFQHFAGERAKLLDPTKTTNSAGDLNSSAVKGALDQRLRELKIDPTPKDDGGNDAARVGAIRRYVDEQVLSAQRAAGKKFTDAETTAFIDKLAAQSTELKGWFGNTHPGLAIGASASDIPSATRDSIKASFKKQGVPEPTDAQILNAFLHLTAPKK